MRTAKYFISTFLLLSLVIVGYTAIAQVTGVPELPDVPVKEKIFGFFKDVDGLNILLLVFATFFGGLWAMGRSKIKQAGELLLKVYEYSDAASAGGKKITQAEREDIINRVLMILGKIPQASKFVNGADKGKVKK